MTASTPTSAPSPVGGHTLIGELTLEEKAGLVSGGSFWRTRGIERLNLPPVTLTDGPHGVRLQAGAGDHLGINDSEPATAFPTGSSLGSSWDPALLEEIGRALAAEARTLDVDVLLGPGINIKRSPLCGRNFEYLSEDPLLSGVLGAAWVNGVQAQGVGASVKHFAANNQETDRMRVDAVVDERTLREIYLPAFETVVLTAKPATVMSSYNRLNGTHTSQNRWLLTDLLRDEWGFEGYVVSDWGAVTDPIASLQAGLDLEMPSTGDRGPQAIVDAVRSGRLDTADLDLAVSRVLRTHHKLRSARRDTSAPDMDAHHQLSARAAAEGAVLLRNEGQLLPLDPHGEGSLAVIGEFARTPRFQGAGSSKIKPTRIDDALTAIEAATRRGVIFEAGFSIESGAEAADNDHLRSAAVQAARTADTAILFLGLPAQEESEGFDRTTMSLPVVQIELLTAVLEVNKRVIVVLSNGGVVELHQSIDQAPAVLEMWLGGQASGTAAAALLFGMAEPGGRLAETIPQALSHNPAHVNWPGADSRVLYGERIYVGYRWYDATERAVSFPFGHGLSYTTFTYSDFQVTVDDPTQARAIATLTVTNTGSRRGSDVVQLYINPQAAMTDRPARELKAFQKVHLEPGEATTVRFELVERAFAYWSPAGWTVDAGGYRVEVGASSRDVRDSITISLDVPTAPTALRADSTLKEWMDHPVGGPVLQGMFDQMGGTPAEFQNPEMLMLIGSMPLASIISINAGVNGHDVVSELLAHTEAAVANPLPVSPA